MAFPKGKIGYWKGKKRINLHTEEHKKELREVMKGNTRGFKKGQIAWNKGLKYKNPKQSEKMKGRIPSRCGNHNCIFIICGI